MEIMALFRVFLDHPSYVLNLHFYTRISYVLNENMWYLKNSTFFQNKEKGAICQMLPFVTQYCIFVNILVNAKGIICHVTPFNSN